MSPRLRIALVALIMTLVAAGAPFSRMAQGATLTVPSQFPTLSAALENAGRGDVIEVAPGLYSENGLVLPGGVVITGMGAQSRDVLIDGGSSGRIFLLESLADTVTIRNITFVNGRSGGENGYDQGGGAILISNSYARIENCVFSSNHAAGNGGAIRISNSNPIISGCDFFANTAQDGGGGALAFSYNSAGRVTDCSFQYNQADWGGAVSCRGGSSPRVENSDLISNSARGRRGFGGGVFADSGSYPDFLNSTIAENSAPFGGGLASWRGGAINLDYCTVAYNQSGLLEGGMLVNDSSPLITGTILAFNQGRGIAAAGQSFLQLSCSNLYGNTYGDWVMSLDGMEAQGGNMSIDPGFCGAQTGIENTFHLSEASGLLQVGAPCGVLGAKPVSCPGDKALVEVPVATAGIERVSASPNPFNPQTRISFEIAQAQDLRVSIYGIDGRLVHELARGAFQPGAHEMAWNGRDRSGRQVSSGTYFVIVKGREDTERLKVTLLK